MKKLSIALIAMIGLVGCESINESIQKVQKDLHNIKGRATNYKTLSRFKYYYLNELSPSSIYVIHSNLPYKEVANHPYSELRNMISGEYGKDGIKLFERFGGISYDSLLKDFPEEQRTLKIVAQTSTNNFNGAMRLAGICKSYEENGYSSISEYKEYGRRKANLWEQEIEKRKTECNVFKDPSHPLYDSKFYIEMLEKYLEKYYQ